MKNIQFILALIICCFSSATFAQKPHLWKLSSEKPQVRISQDLTKAVVFTFDRISTWNLETGELIKMYSTYIDSEERWPTSTAKLIDADASLNELIFLDNDKYYRFLMFMDAYSAFPQSSVKIQRYHGYVNGNDLVVQYRESIKKPSIIGIQKQVNPIPTKIYSPKKFLSQVAVTLDKKAIVFRDTEKYQVYDVSNSKVSNLPIKGTKLEFETMPDGWIGAYGANRFELGFVNYLTGEKEFYKKSEGANVFQPKAFSLPKIVPQFLVRANESKVVELVYFDNLVDRNKTYYAFGFWVYNKKGSQELVKINFSQSLSDFQEFRSEINKNKLVDFKEYKLNFNKLPSNFKFDYNQAQARDITNLRFVQSGEHPMLGETEFAIGSLGVCLNGEEFLLVMGFTDKGGVQTSSFAVLHYDESGNLLDWRDLGKTIRSSTGVIQVTNFEIKSSLNFHNIYAKIEAVGKAPIVRNYAMGCGN
ncbi:hypothetical protein [Mongoliitalea lutea]|uniref:Uncharacterized protein n=1 Tax=Mongoliitalea lutea TaxID=849756 RepID=A0A8J3D4X3_9BACT|nr:hypothetical protein [Mongoliitalea lutea]GHB50775.1 hypothetical protein GCM10008106_34480 [Mongoliitalea lutea]